MPRCTTTLTSSGTLYFGELCCSAFCLWCWAALSWCWASPEVGRQVQIGDIARFDRNGKRRLRLSLVAAPAEGLRERRQLFHPCEGRVSGSNPLGSLGGSSCTDDGLHLGQGIPAPPQRQALRSCKRRAPRDHDGGSPRLVLAHVPRDRLKGLRTTPHSAVIQSFCTSRQMKFWRRHPQSRSTHLCRCDRPTNRSSSPWQYGKPQSATHPVDVRQLEQVRNSN
jgi:hypothetical protein